MYVCSYIQIPVFQCDFCHVGKGAVYGYDAVGSFKRDDYGAMGSGQNFVVPLLDNLVNVIFMMKIVNSLYV